MQAILDDFSPAEMQELQHLSYEQRLLYLPLLRGLMFEKENVTWCEAAIELIQKEM
jgi:hypothetical protein